MAVGYLTSSTLVDTIKREAMLPTNQSTFQNSDFWAMANQELRVSLVPYIISFHEEYLVRDSDAIPLVANQNNYAIPYRAVGGKFREVFYKDTNGNLRSMTRISPDDRAYYQQSNFQGRFVYFFIEGSEVVLTPDVGSNPTGSLMFSYYMRPNELVDPSRVATITAIVVNSGAGTTSFNVDQIPAGFTSSVKLDLLQTNPSHKTIAFDKNATLVDTTNKIITFTTTDVPSSLIVGDYIAFAGECVIPQIPADLHDVLAQRVVTRCLLALGDQMGYQAAKDKLADMQQSTAALIDNRSEGQPQKINNLRGLIRSAKIRKRGWL